MKELTDSRRGGVKDVKVLIDDLNPVLRGWGNYFRTGNAALKFLQLDKYVVRRLNMFRLKRLGVVLGLATGFALAATAPALAASATATATVNAGTLSLTTSAAPSVSVTLDGSDQTPTYTAARKSSCSRMSTNPTTGTTRTIPAIRTTRTVTRIHPGTTLNIASGTAVRRTIACKEAPWHANSP